MAGYTKLFSEIVTSTIWQEDDKTRIIWITMLALSNKYGEVSASVPGLAHTAHVKLSECEKALKKLESPDRYSRSQEYDGRRIGRIDGGFKILNYGKYRERMRSEDRKEYLRIKQAELRARRKKQKCQQNQPESTDMQKAEAEARFKKNKILFCQTSDEIRLSELLFSLILERKKDFKKPDIQRWAKHIDRMIRLDERAPEQIEAVIRWCQKDDFWQNNILSTQKLRKQFDQLELKMTPAGETMEQQMERLHEAGEI